MQEYYCTLCLLEAATIHIKKLASSYSASGFSSVADQYNPRESSLHSSQSSVQPSTSVSSGDSKVTVLETATFASISSYSQRRSGRLQFPSIEKISISI